MLLPLRALMIRDQQIIDAALKVLDPPRAKREKWRKHIEEALNLQQFLQNNEDELEWAGSKQGKKALTRYVEALREVRASYAALNPSIQEFLPQQMFSIEDNIIGAEDMQTRYSRPRKRPVNKLARSAVGYAGVMLVLCGLQLDNTRNGKWHELAKVLADTRSDLRHYMDQFPWRETGNK